MNYKSVLVLIGIVFVLLGFMQYFDFVYIPSIAFLGYIIASVLFIMVEIIERLHKKILNIPFIYIYISGLRFLAISSIIIIPMLNEHGNFDRFTYPIAMFSFGLLFITISYDELFNCLIEVFKNKGKKQLKGSNEVLDSGEIYKSDIANESNGINEAVIEENNLLGKTRKFRIDDKIRRANIKREEHTNESLNDTLKFYFYKE